MASQRSFLREIVVGVIVAVIGGMVVWYLGFTEPRSNSNIQSFSTEQPNLPPVQPDPKPQTASINIAYTGDMHACVIPITLTIAGQTFTPQGNFHQVSGIPIGSQSYSIVGSIQCPSIGTCEAGGQGTLNVTQGATYNIIWQNTGYARCSVVLQ